MRLIHIITGAALALSIANHGAGQTAKEEPLKCGKYQHIESPHVECSKGGNGTPVFCDTWVPEQCSDDIHIVTEREWQELMDRLRKLENKEAQKGMNNGK